MVGQGVCPCFRVGKGHLIQRSTWVAVGFATPGVRSKLHMAFITIPMWNFLMVPLQYVALSTAENTTRLPIGGRRGRFGCFGLDIIWSACRGMGGGGVVLFWGILCYLIIYPVFSGVHAFSRGLAICWKSWHCGESVQLNEEKYRRDGISHRIQRWQMVILCSFWGHHDD